MQQAQQGQPSYSLLVNQLAALLEGQRDFVTNQSQFAALIFHSLTDISWAGFYWSKENSHLNLGSYQGNIACAQIAIGEGVCGKVAQQKQAHLVSDVNQFDGHIACDLGSQSELVYPIIKNEQLLGVFDIDSYSLGRFNQADLEGIGSLIDIFMRSTDF